MICDRCKSKMERKDTILLQQIAALAKVNNEIIERLKSKINANIIVGYKYTLSNNGRTENALSVSENKITEQASNILASWCPSENLIKLKIDYFNDNLDFSCDNFEDIIRLNKEMVRVSEKYTIFDCTESALDVIKNFKLNFETLHVFLGDIEQKFQDEQSRLEKLEKSASQLNENLKNFALEVTNVNEEEDKQQKEKKEKLEKMKGKKNERELFKKYPGCTLEEARAKFGLIINHITQISSWLGQKQFKLIYKATRDGLNATNFHQKCNNQGETLTVFQSSDGYLFGGYTPISWTSRGSHAFDQRTFIFTLTNPYYIQPTKFPNSGPNHNNTYSIYDVASYFPTFGGGNDISCQGNTCSFNFPWAFSDSTGRGSNIFTGSNSCQVKEIEVFLVF